MPTEVGHLADRTQIAVLRTQNLKNMLQSQRKSLKTEHVDEFAAVAGKIFFFSHRFGR